MHGRNAMPQDHDDCKSDIEFIENKIWMAVVVDMDDHPVVGLHARMPKAADPTQPHCNYFSLWFWLMKQAHHKPVTRIIANRTVRIDRGQLACSQAFLAVKANWSRKAVRHFLDKLEKFGMIKVTLSEPVPTAARLRPDQGQGMSIITICNYGKYQKMGTPRGQRGAKQGPGRGQAGARITTEDRDTKDRDTLHQSVFKVDIQKDRSDAHVREDEEGKSVIALDRFRLVLSPRAREIIETMRSKSEIVQSPDEYLMRARAEAAKGKVIRNANLYCVVSAGRDLGLTKQIATALWNGDAQVEAALASTAPKSATPVNLEVVKRMSAPSSARSNLGKTSLLKR